MKKIIIGLLIGVVSYSQAFSKTTCRLSRSGVQFELEFTDYVSYKGPLLSDPSCNGAMSRICPKITIKVATLSFSDGVKIVHWIEKVPIYLSSRRDHTYLKAYLKGELIKSVRGEYRQDGKYHPPSIDIQIGQVMKGGYTLHCTRKYVREL